MKPHLYVLPLLFFLGPLTAQQPAAEKRPIALELDYFYGSILEHNPDIAHLITHHPRGFVLTLNRKTYGFNEWERRYRYPDWGATFVHQNMVNPFLGENYSLYGHFNWYFFKRNLVVRLGQGIAYATSPYNEVTNINNNAYGTRFLSSTFLKANYVRENLYKGLGFHAGFSIIHYSNANLRAPNNSTNTWAFNVGISYLVGDATMPGPITKEDPPSRSHAEKVKYNIVFRHGYNESDIVGQGQFPFYVASAFVDKRINYKSTLQVGADVFFLDFMKELILFQSIAYPEEGLTGNEDHKRVGLFVGHELR
ncbi:MAG: acyloxyacyl hydrolase, partial [Marinirhabdus sp.]